MRHFYRSIIIALTIFSLPSGIKAQEEERMISGTIEWTPAIHISPAEILLNFEGAVNHDDYGLLPILHIPVPSSTGFITTAILAEAEYQPLDLINPDNYPDLDLVGAEAVAFISSRYERKQRKEDLYIVPLRKSPAGDGYEMLVSYSVTLRRQQAGENGNRASGRTYVANSVLRSGDWYRLAVRQTGIHKISYADLENMGVDMAATDPRQIRIYGNGNGMLEEAVSVPRPDDLVENSIYVQGESDGSFDPEDYILFYGEDPVTISYNAFYQKYEHQVNYYSDNTYYFLSTGQGNGKRVMDAGAVTQEPTHIVNTFQDLIYHEINELNLIKSGQIWYGEVFNTQLDYEFDFDIPHLDISEPLYLKVSLAGRSTTSTTFNISTNGELLQTIDVPSVVLGSSIYARTLTSNYEQFFSTGDLVSVGITFNKPGTTDMGWLNYIEINVIRELVFDGGQLNFRDVRSTGADHIAQYEIGSTASNVRIWNVTDQASISALPVSPSGNGYLFKNYADELSEYIIFDGSAYYTPEFVEKVENQDLHSLQPAEFIIVAYPDFLEQARRLADFHRQHDEMSVHIVTPQQIYNEFSSGAQDVSAIRDFMKMLYDRSDEGAKPMYLLLFGDASYDFKGILPDDNNLVPAYQSRESLKMAASFVTDDFFGCLDEDEGGNGSGTVDIGIGRFPVHSMEQAVEAVDKVFRYAGMAKESFGPWRNEICFVGDDEDNNIHLNQAEGLADIADSLGGSFNVSKVYLDAYAQLQTPSGTRYPDVNLAIDESVNTGSLLVNYTGHGGEIGWAHERVLDIPAIQAYKNAFNMPAFVTATCEFSRYDDPGLISAGELVLMNPDGAGIGLFTTTRLAYSQSNYSLNKRFYYEAFRIDSLTGDYPRMGDLIRVSKTPSNQNIKNFVLLGDPALMMAYPKMKVRTLEIINENEGRPADTIHALSRVTIRGQVEDLDGSKLTNYHGILYTTVFDKPVVYKTRGNDPTSKVTEFQVQDKVLYKGESSIDSGEFEFSFIVPKDISYQFGEGKISYYALDTISMIDASGHDAVCIGGSDDLTAADETGPSIELYLNHYEFRSGDITTESPMLIAKLFDESGINTVGNGIGHDIVAVVDGNYKTSVILNDKFNPDTDSFQGGEILYQFGPFDNGLHTLTLKAWDVYNNSSEETIEFQVNTGERLAISGVQIQPNPFSTRTDFVFNHNKPGVGMDVMIRVFNLMGQFVSQIEYSFNTESLLSVPYQWDGRDGNGNELPAGLYVYLITVTSDDGFVSEVSQKLMICR